MTIQTVSTQARRWAKGVFFGWWVLAACVSIQMLIAGFTMQSFGTYLAVLQAEFGWSATALSAAFAIQQAAGGFLGPAVGWLIQRIGARVVIRIGLGIFAGGLLLLSTISSLLGLYSSVVVVALGASLAGFLPLNTVAVQWFNRWRSTALALMQTGISLSGLAVPLVAWALIAYGWRPTIVVTAGLVLLVGLPLTFVIGNRPEDYGLMPDGGPSKRLGKRSPKLVNPGRDFTAKEALKTRAFWFISFGHALALTVVFATIAHIVIYLSTERGFSLQLAGLIVTVLTSSSIFGQLLGGFLGDKLNKQYLATGAMFGHGSALLILALGPGMASVLGFALIHGVSWGVRGPIMSAIRADYFGRTHYAQILGYSQVIVTLGIVGGPLLVGYLADKLGSYQVGFLVLSVLAGVGSLFFVFANPPNTPEAQE